MRREKSMEFHRLNKMQRPSPSIDKQRPQKKNPRNPKKDSEMETGNILQL